MNSSNGMAVDHLWRTVRMLLETAGVSLVLMVLSIAAWKAGASWLVWFLAIPRGLWILRHYCVGHEASHLKLFPNSRLLNAVVGQLFLLLLLTPLAVFRKIHMFHHGYNRRDQRTSALELIWVRSGTWYWRTLAWVQWLFATFFCGWFWHGIISILLFLCLPIPVARQISPAFEGWRMSERVQSIVVFVIAMGIQLAPLFYLGVGFWLALWGAPLLVFSWVYSAHLYIYHYHTGIGPEVRQHARHLGGRGASWLLLNLNQHDAHHQQPAVVWYAIPAMRRVMADPEQGSGRSIGWGVINQLHGPQILVRGQRVDGQL